MTTAQGHLKERKGQPRLLGAHRDQVEAVLDERDRAKTSQLQLGEAGVDLALLKVVACAKFPTIEKRILGAP